MKKLEKGFIVPLLIIVILVLVIGGGIYIYLQKQQIFQDVKLNSSKIKITSPSAGAVWQEGNTYTISVENLEDGVEYDMFLADAQDKSRIIAIMDSDDFGKIAHISSSSPSFKWQISPIIWEGSAPTSYKIYIIDVVKYQNAILSGNANYPIEAESPAFTITTSGQGQLIVNKQMDNSNNLTISWQFPQPMNAALEMKCYSDLVTVYNQTNNIYDSCDKAAKTAFDVAEWTNQTGGTVTLNLSGNDNNKPITVRFTLKLITKEGYVPKWEDFDVTFPAAKK